MAKKAFNPKSLFKGTESFKEELNEAKAIKSGKISPVQYARGEESEKEGKPKMMARGGKVKKFAEGGKVVRGGGAAVKGTKFSFNGGPDV
jgi:hypothetical protein